MIRNLKVLGLALGAVFAIGALSAASASAVTDTLTTSDGQNAIATGVSTHTPAGSGTSDKFTITSANVSVQCTTAKFAATIENGKTSTTVDVEYSGKLDETPHSAKCNSTLGDVTAVDMEECDYNLSGVTHTTASDGTDAAVWITCPVGKAIKITGPAGVTITVPAQTPTATPLAGQPGGGGVTYTNLPNHPGGAAITITSTVTGITYNCDGFGCALAGIPSHGNDADYNGHTIVTCYGDTEGLPTPVTEGAQKGCSVS